MVVEPPQAARTESTNQPEATSASAHLAPAHSESHRGVPRPLGAGVLRGFRALFGYFEHCKAGRVARALQAAQSAAQPPCDSLCSLSCTRHRPQLPPRESGFVCQFVCVCECICVCVCVFDPVPGHDDSATVTTGAADVDRRCGRDRAGVGSGSLSNNPYLQEIWAGHHNFRYHSSLHF